VQHDAAYEQTRTCRCRTMGLAALKTL
jgi:hypothetical protein